MTDEEMNEKGFHKMKVRVVLKYKEKEYILEQEDWIHDEDLDEIKGGGVPYIWDEGNYSCDCNRSLFLHRVYLEFPDFEHCGNEIELVEYELLGT